MIMINKSGKRWNTTAKFGRSFFGDKKIWLWNHVVIHQTNKAGGDPTTMKTVFLTIFPHQQFAETNKPVVIIQPGTIVNSVGLRAHMQQGTIRLLSHARGEYVPPKPSTSTSTGTTANRTKSS